MARGPADNSTGKPDGGEPAADGRDAQVRDILRRIYDDTLVEPVPDSFADLLKRLG